MEKNHCTSVFYECKLVQPFWTFWQHLSGAPEMLIAFDLLTLLYIHYKELFRDVHKYLQLNVYTSL